MIKIEHSTKENIMLFLYFHGKVYISVYLMERAGTAVTLNLLITQDGMFSLGFVPHTKAI